jgi:DNA-binding transcriptional MerR regulator
MQSTDGAARECTPNTAPLSQDTPNGQPSPRKTYYSISEVCALASLEPHVLRYWEGEFPQLRPKKNRAGNRAYRDKDIELIEHIKYLLYDEQYTIQGAKKKCAQFRDREARGRAMADTDELGVLTRKEVIRALREVVSVLRGV